MNDIADIAHTIQLAVAPVFLLVGIGGLLNVVTTRLARVIDRARVLEERAMEPHDKIEADRIRDELITLDRRMQLAQRAILIFSAAALIVCILVATLFAADFLDFSAGVMVGVMFIAIMGLMAGGLIQFINEIQIATRSLHVRADLLAK